MTLTSSQGRSKEGRLLALRKRHEGGLLGGGKRKSLLAGKHVVVIVLGGLGRRRGESDVGDEAGLLVGEGRDVHHVTGRRHGDGRGAEAVVLDKRGSCELL